MAIANRILGGGRDLKGRTAAASKYGTETGTGKKPSKIFDINNKYSRVASCRRR